MVRRERNLRRLQPRITLDDASLSVEASGSWARLKNFGLKIKNAPIFDPLPSQELSEIESPAFRDQPVLMADRLPRIPIRPQASVLGHQVPQVPTRQEVVQQRIRDITASQAPILDPDIVSERRRTRPKCTCSKSL